MNKEVVIILSVIIALFYRPLQCKPLNIENKDNYDDGTLVESEYHGNLDRKTIDYLRKCDRDLKTMELCMRCAKITKSTIVYPLCCGNEDKVQDWCHDYVFFGA